MRKAKLTTKQLPKRIGYTTLTQFAINNTYVKALKRNREYVRRAYELLYKMDSELTDKCLLFKPYKDWQFIEASLTYYKPKIIAIIRNQMVIDNITIFETEDVYQEICTRYYNNKSILQPLSFFSRIKWLTKDIIRTEKNRYRKFKCSSFQDEELDLVNEISLSYVFNLDIETKIDMQNLFTDSLDLQVYKLILAGKTNRQIYDLLQYNCQRVIKRVKDTIAAYVLEYI